MADLERAGAAAGDGRLALLLVIDVDDFRAFNAEHGHAASDEHLACLARRLLDLVPGRAYRLGGDGFAVLLEGSARAVWAGGVRVLLALEPVRGQAAPRCSFGAAAASSPSGSPFDALALAEARLENQKQRAPLVPERYAELLLTLVRAQQPDTSDHAEDVAQLAGRVAARLGIDAPGRALRGCSTAAPSCAASTPRGAAAAPPAPRSRSSTATSTTSRASTTRSATRPATTCCAPSPRPSAAPCARTTPSSASAATSLR